MIQNRDSLEPKKEQIFDRYMKELTDLYTKELEKIMMWWVEKFPKKELRFYSGMGIFGFEIDGEDFDCEVDYVSHIANISGNAYLSERQWTRKQILLKPLVDYYNSLKDHTWLPDCGVYPDSMSTSDII
jgi:hypothetical protein